MAAAAAAAAGSRRVTVAGVGADLVTLGTVQCRQVLLGMQGYGEAYWHHLLLHRIRDALWVTCDPNMVVQVDDLNGEEIVPLGRGTAFPGPGRPFRTFAVLTDAQIASIFAQGDALATVHGVVVAGKVAASTDQLVWLFSDPAVDCFGDEIANQLLADARTAKLEADAGIVFYATTLGSDEAEWTSAALVKRTKIEEWRARKREGAGRDPRLSSLRGATLMHEKPLLRVVLASCGKPQDPNRRVFTGPSATAELIEAIVKTGMEIPQFIQHSLTNMGANSQGAAGTQLVSELWALHFMIVEDRLDPYSSTAAEHLARSILRLMRALRRNGKAPDFSGLQGYLSHLGEPGGSLLTPSFDRHIADLQRDDAQHLKQQRLNREELGHEDKHKKDKQKDPKGKGKGDQGGE